MAKFVHLWEVPKNGECYRKKSCLKKKSWSIIYHCLSPSLITDLLIWYFYFFPRNICQNSRFIRLISFVNHWFVNRGRNFYLVALMETSFTYFTGFLLINYLWFRKILCVLFILKFFEIFSWKNVEWNIRYKKKNWSWIISLLELSFYEKSTSRNNKLL